MFLLELKNRNGALDAIHIIGIGGIGMSGIATILSDLGYTVQGSDLAETSNTKRLENAGIKIYIGQAAENILNVSYVIVSTAIDKSNPEIQEAERQKIPVVRRAEILAELMRSKCSISVAGTHGKTTTTSLTACLFEAAGFCPTVINGGIMNSRFTNAYIGSDEFLIAEADESDGTFLHLPSTIAVITNIDADHLDFYKDFDSLANAFKTCVTNLPFYGFAVACIDHAVVRNLVSQIRNRKIITYGIENVDANIQALNLEYGMSATKFDVKIIRSHGKDGNRHISTIQQIILPTPGRHNVLNALAAISIAVELDFDMESIKNGFNHFEGVKRRFSKVGVYNGATVIDDYAHHPEEVKATLATAKFIANKQNAKVIAIFQPQRYTRTHNLFEEFASCFSDADHLYITDIYAAGEKPIEGITGRSLVEQIQSSKSHPKASFIACPEDIPTIIRDTAMPGDMIIMMGAGSISSWANNLSGQLMQFN